MLLEFLVVDGDVVVVVVVEAVVVLVVSEVVVDDVVILLVVPVVDGNFVGVGIAVVDVINFCMSNFTNFKSTKLRISFCLILLERRQAMQSTKSLLLLKLSFRLCLP